ncbi:MAG: hypothetical protein GY940_38120 [bacterium]|nr:hypothetical protein [bacterium]
MRTWWKLIVIVFTILPGFIYTLGANRNEETFEILRGDIPKLFIESDRQSDEKLPVVFCIGKLEISQMFEVEELTSVMDFIVYEQNPVRTRMRPAGKDNKIRLEINREREQGTLYLGSRLFFLNPIRVKLRQTSLPGLYRLVFSGKGVYTYSTFVLEDQTGNIYQVPHHISLANFNFNHSYLWAVRVTGQLHQFKSGGIK